VKAACGRTGVDWGSNVLKCVAWMEAEVMCSGLDRMMVDRLFQMSIMRDHHGSCWGVGEGGSCNAHPWHFGSGCGVDVGVVRAPTEVVDQVQCRVAAFKQRDVIRGPVIVAGGNGIAHSIGHKIEDK